MITYKDGSKGKGDKKVFWNGKQVTFLEIANIVSVLCHNEDIIYPKPKYRGGQMLIDFLQEIYDQRGISDECKRKFRLGPYRP